MQAPRKYPGRGTEQPEGAGPAQKGAGMLGRLVMHIRRERLAQLAAAVLAPMAAFLAVLVIPIDTQWRLSLATVTGLAAPMLAGLYVALHAWRQARRSSIEQAAIRAKLEKATDVIVLLQRAVEEARHGQAAQMERLLAEKALAESALGELSSRMQAMESRLSAETDALREKQSHMSGVITFLQRTVREQRCEQAAQTDHLIADKMREAALATEASSQKMRVALDSLHNRLHAAEADLAARISKVETAAADAAQTALEARDDLTVALEDMRKRLGRAETAIADRAAASALSQVRDELARAAAAERNFAEAEQERLAAMTDLARRVSDLAVRLGDNETRFGRRVDEAVAGLRADMQAVEGRVAEVAAAAEGAGAAGAAGLANLEQRLLAVQSQATQRSAEIAAAAEAQAAETSGVLAALKTSLADIVGLAREGAQTAAAGIASARREIADLLARVEESEDAGVREIDKLTLRITELEAMQERTGPAVEAQALAVLRAQIAEAVHLSEQAARQTFRELATIKTLSERLAAMEMRHASLARALETPITVGLEPGLVRDGDGATAPAPRPAAEETPIPANDPHNIAKSRS